MAAVPSKYSIVIEASSHAELSASAASRWINCPGSVRETKGLTSATSFEAAEGTAAHYIAALAQSQGIAPAKWLNTTALVEGIEISIGEEMVESLNDFLAHVTSDTAKEDVVLIEQSITAALQTLHPKLGGSADRVRFKPKERSLRITDLKYGSGVVVDVVDNVQLKIYALGAILTFAHLKPTKVEIEIAQPRIDHPDGRYRVWAFDAVDIIDFAADILDAARRTEQPDAPLVPGKSQCRWCPAAHFCPALEAQQMAIVAVDFDDLTRVSPEKISKALEMIPLIEARIAAIREYAYQEAEKGNAPPGFKLVDKRAVRKWVSVESVQKRLLHRPEYYTSPELRSPAQIEKILGKKDFERILGECVEKISSGHTLVPVSDPRPEVKLLTADDMFGEEESE